MKSMSCIIVDDEPGAHRVLVNYIEKVDWLELQGSYYNARDALPALVRNPASLIFLDINMPEISGFSFLRMIENPPLVIIVSAYSDYALESYDFNVLDYLLKPIRFERFLNAIEKARAIYDTARVSRPKMTYIEIKHKGEEKKVNLTEILYIQSIGNYVKIVTRHINYLVHLTTSEVETLLSASDFIRIHKSYIVNQNFITLVNKENVEVTGSILLPVGKTYKKYISVFLK
ncbi:MAG: LytTR family DNA-binding domain-containing protein [Bacteroidota bacterium]